MTKLQKEGLKVVAQLKVLTYELYGPKLGAMYMRWAARSAQGFQSPKLALVFVNAQVQRLSAQKLEERSI